MGSARHWGWQSAAGRSCEAEEHFLNTLLFARSLPGCTDVSTGARKANAVLHVLAASLWLCVSELLSWPSPCWQDLAAAQPRSAPHSALVSTRPIVCMCKYTSALLVPKPRLFCSQKARMDNVRKASIPWLCSTLLTWRKDPWRGARSRCVLQHIPAAGARAALASPAEGSPRPCTARSPQVPTSPSAGMEQAGPVPAMGRGERRWQRPGALAGCPSQGPTAEPAPSEEGQVLSLCKHRPKSSTTKVHSAGGSPGAGTADGTLPFAAVKARILCAASSEGQSRLRGTSCPRSGCCSTVGPA